MCGRGGIPRSRIFSLARAAASRTIVPTRCRVICPPRSFGKSGALLPAERAVELFSAAARRLEAQG